MSDIAIKADGLSKAYIITHQRKPGTVTLREALTHKVKNALSGLQAQQGRSRDGEEQFWALKDASFEIKRGARVGIVGRNGAGKSTLLRILSRITDPTAGRVEITGRVASLLEVGTGFHAELTGRENIFLNGAILGMRRTEIKKKFDEIVAFAEVEQFLDTPVKRYSSGMYVRLAFAVAAHLESEILLVDEVLAVGDAAFQKKCLGKMQDVSAQEDRTILFVSHNMTAIQSLCNTGILLKKGCIQTTGDICSVIQEYFSNEYRCQLTSQWDLSDAPGNDAIRVKKFQVVPESDDQTIDVTTPLQILAEFFICQDNVIVNEVAMVLKNTKGDCIFATVTPCNFTKGLNRAAVHIPGNFLNDDTYTTDFYFSYDASIIYFQYDCLVFQVHDIPRRITLYLGKWSGAVRPALQWDCRRLAEG
jgi:lipopolysaccharide transport system ATP-binding protein